MAENGMTGQEIKEYLEEQTYNNDIYITLQSLKRIIKTGRITKAGAAIATVLNLKPVLKIQGGKLDAYAKVRGMDNAEKKMFEAVHSGADRPLGRNDKVGIPGLSRYVQTSGVQHSEPCRYRYTGRGSRYNKAYA